MFDVPLQLLRVERDCAGMKKKMYEIDEKVEELTKLMRNWVFQSSAQEYSLQSSELKMGVAPSAGRTISCSSQAEGGATLQSVLEATIGEDLLAATRSVHSTPSTSCGSLFGEQMHPSQSTEGCTEVGPKSAALEDVDLTMEGEPCTLSQCSRKKKSKVGK